MIERKPVLTKSLIFNIVQYHHKSVKEFYNNVFTKQPLSLLELCLQNRRYKSQLGSVLSGNTIRP